MSSDRVSEMAFHKANKGRDSADKIRALSSLDPNKPSAFAKKISSLKAVLAATEAQDAPVVAPDKENEGHGTTLARRKRVPFDSNIDGLHGGFKRLKETKDVIGHSSGLKDVGLLKFQKEESPVHSSKTIDHDDLSLGDLQNLKDLGCRGNGSGLSILGEAAFLSLGLDEVLNKLHRVEEGFDEDKFGNCAKKPDKDSSSADYFTSFGRLKQGSSVISADLTLRPSIELENVSQGHGSRDEIADKAIDMTGKNAAAEELNSDNCMKGIWFQSSQTEDPTLKHGKANEKYSSSHGSEQENVSLLVDEKEILGKQSVAYPPRDSQVSSLCSFVPETAFPRTSMDCKSTYKSHYPDNSLHVKGTLLLPRGGNKRTGKHSNHVRKLRPDSIKQKREVGKKEQTSKFSRVAAPSGLLADLNPGIINRVRNSRQVHAIIEAVVGTDALLAYQQSRDSLMHDSEIGSYNNDSVDHVLDNGDSEVWDTQQDAVDALESRKGNLRRVLVSEELDQRISGSCGSEYLWEQKDKYADPQWHDSKKPMEEHTKLDENFRCWCKFCCTKDQQGLDLRCSSSLSVKAAIVASQWLDINCQDMKGRLAALKRSRKRIRALIKERFGFSATQELAARSKDDAMLVSVERDHMDKWKSLFVHMDNCLASEASQLEGKLKQVTDMSAHCQRGLQEFQRLASSQQEEPKDFEDNLRSQASSAQLIERRFAVEAAAASIYSTANFASLSEQMHRS